VEKEKAKIYGVMAEFEDGEALLAAAKRVREAGYRRMDAYTPIPVEGLWEAIGFPTTRLPFIVLASGMCGACAGFGLQYWVHVINFPLNVGGRPFNSWPSFIPITFEMTILFAALSAVFGMIALNGLPMPYHPVFNVPAFERASTDRFFLCIEAQDPKFNLDNTKQFLKELHALEVSEVEP
jgi:hypothetical protein